jgi:hypothetical protein
MSTLIDTPRSAGFQDGFIFVILRLKNKHFPVNPER